jgi:hypothetical protein
VFRKRLTRLVSVAATASLAVMLLGVGGAVAKTPAGWGLSAAGIVGTISPGASQGYIVTITNRGPSNIAKLYLTTLDTSGGGAGTPISPVFSDLGSPCDTGVNQGCSLGAFPNGRTLTFTLGYTAAAGDSPFKIEFDINTNGYVLGQNSSHGDSFPFNVSTPVNSSHDFAGGWTLGSGAVFSTSGTLGTHNLQNTTVQAPSTHIPVTVDDSGTATFDCSASTKCGHAFGVWTSLNVNNGTTYSGSAFQVTLLLYGKSIPSGVTTSQISVLHVLDGGTTETLTQTGNACPATPSTTTADCIASVTKTGQNYTIVLWLIQNGGLRGAY